jgi:hypothetical protein
VSSEATLEDIMMDEDRELADELFGSGTELLKESKAMTAVAMDIDPPTLPIKARDHSEPTSQNPNVIKQLNESIKRNKQ